MQTLLACRTRIIRRKIVDSAVNGVVDVSGNEKGHLQGIAALIRTHHQTYQQCYTEAVKARRGRTSVDLAPLNSVMVPMASRAKEHGEAVQAD